MNPVRTFLSHFSKIYSNIILLSMPRFCKWSRPFRFPDQNFGRVNLHLSLTYLPFLRKISRFIQSPFCVCMCVRVQILTVEPTNRFLLRQEVNFQAVHFVPSSWLPFPFTALSVFRLLGVILRRSSSCVLVPKEVL